MARDCKLSCFLQSSDPVGAFFIEQDHRAIKPMMGFKNFRCARIILSGIEVMHMIRKGQMQHDGDTGTAAEQFYSLVM
ncbi:transposase-like protein [Paraburkholderia sp. MM5477-R1]